MVFVKKKLKFVVLILLFSSLLGLWYLTSLSAIFQMYHGN